VKCEAVSSHRIAILALEGLALVPVGRRKLEVRSFIPFFFVLFLSLFILSHCLGCQRDGLLAFFRKSAGIEILRERILELAYMEDMKGTSMEDMNPFEVFRFEGSR